MTEAEQQRADRARRPERPGSAERGRCSAGRLAERYAPIVTGWPAFISFQTVTELRYGAIRRGWGDARILKLDSKVQRAQVVHTDLTLESLA